MKRLILLMLGLSALTVGTVTCGTSDDDSDEAATTTTTDDTGTTATVGDLAIAYPGSLALSVFPTTTTTTLRLSAAPDFEKRTITQKNTEASSVLAGTASDCAPAALKNALTTALVESCYEFDQDMVYGGKSSPGSTGASSITDYLGTTNGLNASNEACLVAFTRSQVNDIIALVDQTLALGMAAICQAKKNDSTVTLPASGQSLDVRTALTGVLGVNGNNANSFSVSAATIERLAENNSDRPVYRTLITTTDSNSNTRDIGIIHSPAADGTNDTYNGTIYVVMTGDLRSARNASAPKSRLLSVTYARTATRIKAQLRTANVAESLAANAITAQGVLDFNTGATFTASEANSSSYGQYTGFTEANDAIAAMTFVSFDMDPSTNEGNLAYWRNPGGNYYENARGFNIQISKDATTSVLKGCATSGAASTDFSSGISIRRFLREGGTLTLSPKGFWHPFFNTASNSGRTVTGPLTDSGGTYYQFDQSSPQQTAKWYVPNFTDTTLATTFVTSSSGSLITRQCFSQNASSGIYEIDTTNTSAAAGYELLDSGVAGNNTKFIALPDTADAAVLPVTAKKSGLR